MGWLYGNDWNSIDDVQASLHRDLAGAGYTVEKTRRTREGGHTVIWDVVSKGDRRLILCSLVSFAPKAKHNRFGLKDMDESSHPYYYSCPLEFLSGVPVTNEKWREGVRAFHARKATRKAGLTVGAQVSLAAGVSYSGIAIGGETVEILSMRPVNIRILTGTLAGTMLRAKRGHLALPETVENEGEGERATA